METRSMARNRKRTRLMRNQTQTQIEVRKKRQPSIRKKFVELLSDSKCDRKKRRVDKSRSTYFDSLTTFPSRLLAGTGTIEVHEMKDSSSCLSDICQLRKILEQDGYLLLRNFLPREEVLKARRCILNDCREKGFIKSLNKRQEDTHLRDAVAVDPTVSPGLLNRQDLAHSPSVKSILEHPNLYTFFEQLFLSGESKSNEEKQTVMSVHYKWLRAVGRGGFTGCHVDRVYMGQGSNRLYTAWIPLGDIKPSQGTLVVCPESHQSEALESLRSTYGTSSVGKDGVQSGWIASNPNSLGKIFPTIQWVTADFNAGDVCILGLDILHMSSTNTTDSYRISCDTRWQPADEPLDPRLKQVID